MSTPPTPDPGSLAGLVAEFRTAWETGGVEGIRALPDRREALGAAEPGPDDHAAQAAYYELLGLDALGAERPGWAFVCLEAAATHAEQASLRGEPARLRRVGGQVLERWFSPYDTGEALLADVRAWARARVVELRHLPADDARPLPDRVAEGAVVTDTTAAKQRWMFRLLHSQRLGRTFRLDDLFRRFRLKGRERVLLRTLAAVHWDPVFDALKGHLAPTSVGLLVDVVADDPAERAAWLACFDARGPLVDAGLIRLGPGASLRHREARLDESVLAWIERRDQWPPEIADVAALHAPDDRPVWPYQDPALLRLRRAIDPSRGAAPRACVRSRSAAASLDLARTWAAASRRPVIGVHADAAPDAETARAIGREARLRDALVFVHASDPRIAARLDRHVRAPLVFHAPPEGAPALHRAVSRLVDVELAPPTPADRPNLWNDALHARGLPELNPRELDLQIGEFPLDHAEVVAVVDQAIERAWVNGERAPRALTPHELRAAALTWTADQG